MLNTEPRANNTDDDSSGSEFVFLDAAAEQEPEDETGNECETSANDEEVPLLAEQEPIVDMAGRTSDSEMINALVEEASDLLLEQFVDDPVTEESSLEDGSLEEEPKAVETTGSNDETENESNVEDMEDLNKSEPGDDVGEDNHSCDEKDNEKEEEARCDDDAKSEEDIESAPGEGKREKEDVEGSKENSNPESINESVDTVTDDFKFGTRGEVNGAAAVFGVAAFIVGGPVVGVLGAVASAHIAANKSCKCADLTRRCGGALDNIGKKKRMEVAAKRTKAARPHIWDTITNKLVEGGEWTEKKVIRPLRHVKAKKPAKVDTE